MIKYLGSKRRLIPKLMEIAAQAAPDARSVVDVFSGTSRVAQAFKRRGLRVLANDHNAYAATLARCYVAADDSHRDDATRLVNELNSTRPRAGWFTTTFCEEARYFTPENGARIEAIRERISSLHLPPELEAVMLVSLMEAADRVDSTVGVQMAFLKSWAPRALQPLSLRVPELLPCSPHGKSEVWQLDALEAAQTLHADVAYLDPPYNQHSYLGNYHVWETLVRFDRPDVYGVARKRVDVQARTSPFNQRTFARTALHDVLGALRAPIVLVSFSDEGFYEVDELTSLLAAHGRIAVHAVDVDRYVGAKIGIYNPSGQRVGRISHTKNRELIFVVDKRAI